MLTLRSTRIAPVSLALAGVLALVLSACSSGKSTDTGAGQPTSGTSSSSGATSTKPTSKAASTSTSAKPKQFVHMVTLNADGATYGVGMPIVARFTRTITSGKALQAATKVTVNGKPQQGAWYFEHPLKVKGYPLEAHFRLESYWPAHSTVHVDIPVKGLSAGGNMVFDNSLTLDFTIGQKNMLTVDQTTHSMTVMSDGQNYGTFPVSLGADNTPTRSGIKVIMQQNKTVCMHDIAGSYYECGIMWDQRLTYDGEYLHSAPWNVKNIGHRDTSNGCTNLRPADAIQLYNYLHTGDVVMYPNANGKGMTAIDGYGDWNVDWGVWQTGGLVSTTT